MPSLDDLGTRQVITGTPAADDVVGFYDVSEFGNSPVKKSTLAGLWSAIQPDVLEIDYLETADRAGLEIPAGAYGQKSGVPYFGNSPLADQLRRRIAFLDIQAQAFSTGIEVLHLGGFTVPAADANDATSFGIQVDLALDSTAVGYEPVSGDNIYLLVRLGTGPVDLTEGSWVKITPASVYELRRFRGALSIVSSAGLLRPALTIASQEIAGGATQSTDATYYPLAAIAVTNDTTTTVAENQATSFQFYLVANWTAAGSSITGISGSVELLAESVVTGALA